MKFIIQFICLFLLYLSNVQAGTINEEAVNALLTKLDNAISTSDVKSMGEVLSENINIILFVDIYGSKQELKLDKKQYLDMFSASLAGAKNYQYSRTSTVITVKDNVATIDDIVNESFSIQDAEFLSVAREHCVVAEENGTLKFTHIGGDMAITIRKAAD